MKFLVFLIILISFQARALDIAEIQELNEAIAETELDKCMNGDSCEITGDVLKNALHDQIEETTTSGNPEATTTTCKYDVKKKKKKPKEVKTVETKLLLVSEINTPQIQRGNNQYYSFYASTQAWDAYFQKEHPNSNSPWPMADIVNTALNASTDESFQRSTFVEGLVQFAGKSKLSESELADQISKTVSAYTSSDAEKMKILTTISDRLYFNYNDKRNPLQNTNHDPIPQGNITLPAMFKAAANWNPDQGGVCNDISKAVATVGEKLFPNKDVLVINNGSHFGVMIHDKNKGTSIISWDIQTDGASQPMIDPKIPVGNTRIFQVRDGIMKEIAVVDTESGAVMKKFFNSPTPTLQTGTPPSVVYADFKREVTTRKTQKQLEFKVGAAETSGSQMLILVGQTTRNGKNSQTTFGVGGAYEKLKNSPQENVILSLHGGYQKNIIHFKSSTVALTGIAGAELDVYAAGRLKRSNTSIDIIPGVSANLQANQTVQFQTFPKNQKNPNLMGQVQTVQTLSSTNEGERQGALSNPDAKKALLNSMKYTGFQLNQVNADATMNVPMKNNVTSVTQAQYQGSNIGQKFKITSGFQVISNGGMKIFAFVGYVNNDIKGYKTKTSLFTQPSGAVAGGGIQTKGGAKFSTEFDGIGRTTPVQGNIKAAIPLFNKREKK